MNNNNLEERFLLNRLIDGDQEVFRYFFSRYYTDLCNLANFYVHDAQISEGIAQEVYTYLWDKKEELRIETSIKLYLIKSVKNRSLNYLRDEQNRNRILEKISSKQKENYQPPEDKTDENLLQQTITNSVNSLPDRCREIYIMGKEKDLTYKQIAQELNISVKTVENQMGKALKTIRADLTPYLHEFLD